MNENHFLFKLYFIYDQSKLLKISKFFLQFHAYRPSKLPHERGKSHEDIDWPTSPVIDDTIDMLNRPETFYNSPQGNIAPSPPTPIRSRISQPTHNHQSSIMSQNLRLSSNSKLR